MKNCIIYMLVMVIAICGCPVSAIEYGHKSQGKPRYQCPEYK